MSDTVQLGTSAIREGRGYWPWELIYERDGHALSSFQVIVNTRNRSQVGSAYVRPKTGSLGTSFVFVDPRSPSTP